MRQGRGTTRCNVRGDAPEQGLHAMDCRRCVHLVEADVIGPGRCWHWRVSRLLRMGYGTQDRTSSFPGIVDCEIAGQLNKVAAFDRMLRRCASSGQQQQVRPGRLVSCRSCPPPRAIPTLASPTSRWPSAMSRQASSISGICVKSTSTIPQSRPSTRPALRSPRIQCRARQHPKGAGAGGEHGPQPRCLVRQR